MDKNKKGFDRSVLTKFLIITMLTLPAVAAVNDDEIIKNLDFFQSMEMLKEEVAFTSHAQPASKEHSKKEKEKVKEKDSEKKQ